MALQIAGRFPTVPEYYTAFIDGTVDLTENPKQCCPFHKEDTPSFSYDYRTGNWSCFGSCHALGKDVVDMHMRWFRFNTRDQAEHDLARRCRVDLVEKKIKEPEAIFINQKKVDLKSTYVQAKMLANTPERWVELDEIMSYYPIPEDELYNKSIDWST